MIIQSDLFFYKPYFPHEDVKSENGLWFYAINGFLTSVRI